MRAGRAPRGVASYLRCLLDELASIPDDDYELIRYGGRVSYAAGALTGRPRLDRLVRGCDVFWAPAPAPIALSRAVPLVLTVHDLSFEHRPRDYTFYERLWHRLARPRELARRAARVIAVSDSVREQLLDEWGLAAETVVTVLSGPGRPVKATGTPPAGLPSRYLLAVGAFEPRKGVELLLEAHARARRDGLAAELVFAGTGPLETAPGVTALGYVTDEQLDALYADALALVSASREEGFGFPPLEALARGTPAVVPDLAPFRETLGDAALRFPAGDAEGLTAALLRLEREPELRARLVAAGSGALGRLSWARAARETRAVLAEAAGT